MPDPNPLNKAWWKEFAASFMEQGEAASGEVTDSIEKFIDEGHKRIQAFITDARAESEASMHAAIDEIRERLEAIEKHLAEQH